MKKAARAISLITVIFIMSATLFGGCTGVSEPASGGVKVTDSLEGEAPLVGDIPCEFPLVKTPTTLDMIAFRPFNTDFKDVYVFQKYEEMTGVSVNWSSVTLSNRDEAIYTALVNNADIDLILRCRVDSSRLMQYAKSGLILDLAKDDLLKNNAPNCWAYLESHPEALASVTNPDGTIYSLPQINSGAELRVSRKIFINKNWLERVNMELPTTTEEMYLLLKAFKEQDANGNGDPADEIPLCSQDWMSLDEAFSGSFGLMNRGVHNTVVDCDEATGKVRFTKASEGYREFLAYFQRLYTEGLLDVNTFTMTVEEWSNNIYNDRVGAFCSTNLAAIPADKVGDWVGITEALEGPLGDKLWTAIRANLHSTGNAIIPAACDDPELVLRWLDYFWTDEGTLFYHMGIEGETFVVDEDGAYDYAPFIYDELNSSNLSFDEVVSRYSPYPGGGNPMVEVAPYFRGGEMADVPAATARALFAYGPETYWPSFTFTPEENETLGGVGTDILKYCTDMRIDFITGVLNMSEWERYTVKLGQLKTDELLKVYQSALDRYESSFAQ